MCIHGTKKSKIAIKTSKFAQNWLTTKMCTRKNINVYSMYDVTQFDSDYVDLVKIRLKTIYFMLFQM